MKAAVAGTPRAVGLELANWSWKVVRQFVQERFGCWLSRSSCWNYLRRLGFVLKRPKKRLLKADPERRAAFVTEYAALRAEVAAQGGQIIFVDEAHFRADVEVRAQWVQKGQPALVDSSSPKLGEKASYYSGVCLETGEVTAMAVEGNCTAGTTVEFLQQLRAAYSGYLVVIWDNGGVHRGPAIREFLRTSNLNLRLVALPPYSPDFNADEAVWDWVRQEVTANICYGTTAKVREHINRFFAGLTRRTSEAKTRCRTILQAQADALVHRANQTGSPTHHVDLTLDSV